MDTEAILKKTYSPRPGGRARLEARLREAEREEAGEVGLLRAAAAAFVLVAFGVGIGDVWLGGSGEAGRVLLPPPGEVRVEGGAVASLPTAIEGVRFYWVFRR